MPLTRVGNQMLNTDFDDSHITDYISAKDNHLTSTESVIDSGIVGNEYRKMSFQYQFNRFYDIDTVLRKLGFVRYQGKKWIRHKYLEEKKNEKHRTTR